MNLRVMVFASICSSFYKNLSNLFVRTELYSDMAELADKSSSQNHARHSLADLNYHTNTMFCKVI